MMFSYLSRFASMVRLSHTVFALPFALSALALVWQDNPQNVTWLELLLVIIAFTCFRSFAMAFNRLADAQIDAKNPRTAMREIPAGRLSKLQVLAFAIVMVVGGFIAAWFLNPLAFWLAWPAVILLVGYSFSKRFTFLCHLWLGMAIGQAPVAVYVALTNSVPPAAIILFLLLSTYIAGFDVLYSLQDMGFDREHGVHSISARFGLRGAHWAALALHTVSASLLFVLPAYTNLGWVYYTGAGLIVVALFMEHRVIGLFSDGDVSRIPAAFFNYNSAVSLLLLAAIGGDVFFV